MWCMYVSVCFCLSPGYSGISTRITNYLIEMKTKSSLHPQTPLYSLDLVLVKDNFRWQSFQIWRKFWQGSWMPSFWRNSIGPPQRGQSTTATTLKKGYIALKEIRVSCVFGMNRVWNFLECTLYFLYETFCSHTTVVVCVGRLVCHCYIIIVSSSAITMLSFPHGIIVVSVKRLRNIHRRYDFNGTAYRYVC